MKGGMSQLAMASGTVYAPAMVSRTVGSSGTSEAEGSTVWPREA